MTQADVRAVLDGLRVGATYPARFLYDRYAELMSKQGRQPAHPAAFGRMLGRKGCLRIKVTKNKVKTSCWIV